MLKKPFAYGALIGGLLATPLATGFGLATALFGTGFPPFILFNWITRTLPGPVVTFGIDLMIDALRLLRIDVADSAKTAEQVMAIFLFVILAVLSSGALFTLFSSRRINPELRTGLILGAAAALPVIVIDLRYSQLAVHPLVEALWLALGFLIGGVLLCLAFRRLRAPGPEPTPTESDVRAVERIDRRQFLITLGLTSASITVVGSGLAAVLSSAKRPRPGLDKTGSEQTSLLPNADDPLKPAPGTRLEYTPIEDHYKVFIQLQPSILDAETWTCPISGLVNNPLTFTLDDLRQNFNAREQYVTLSCISGRIGTSLISTTRWTGASLQEVLNAVQLQPGARYLHIHSADGFFETIDLDLVASDERIMLCYDWDGEPLPEGHGFPLRIWIPDRYGMKQPKWITSIEVSDQYQPGYWVERGWDEVAQVKTTSVIDTVAVDSILEQAGQMLIPIGGIAFSGARGISAVEVRVDGGPWHSAQLRAPLSETTWAIWRYDWPFEQGEHAFEVRCFEADGTVQIEQAQPPRPSGATGVHSVTEIVS